MFQGGRKQGCLKGWSRHLGCVCGQSLGEMFDIASAPFVTSQADYFQKCVLAEAFWRVFPSMESLLRADTGIWVGSIALGASQMANVQDCRLSKLAREIKYLLFHFESLLTGKGRRETDKRKPTPLEKKRSGVHFRRCHSARTR